MIFPTVYEQGVFCAVVLAEIKKKVPGRACDDTLKCYLQSMEAQFKNLHDRDSSQFEKVKRILSESTKDSEEEDDSLLADSLHDAANKKMKESCTGWSVCKCGLMESE